MTGIKLGELFNQPLEIIHPLPTPSCLTNTTHLFLLHLCPWYPHPLLANSSSSIVPLRSKHTSGSCCPASLFSPKIVQPFFKKWLLFPNPGEFQRGLIISGPEHKKKR